MTEAKDKDAVAVQGDLVLAEEVALVVDFQLQEILEEEVVKVKVLEEDLEAEALEAEITETAEEEIHSEQTGKEEDIDFLVFIFVQHQIL